MTTADVKRSESFDFMGRPSIHIESSKNKIKYTISKTQNGFVFYEITASKGSMPRGLQGQFSRIKFAEAALMDYLGKVKKSPTVRRDETYEENHPTKGK